MEKEVNPRQEKNTNKKIDSVSHAKIQNLDMLSEVASKIVETNVNGSEGPSSGADNDHIEGTASPSNNNKN